MLERNTVAGSATPTVINRPKLKKKKKSSLTTQRRKAHFYGYSFMFPAILILLIFSIIPILYSGVLSFFSWDMMTGSPNFIGLKNFSDLLINGELYHSLNLTLLYTVLTVVPSMILGLFFAILLDRKLRGINIYRSFFFAPLMTSTVAISIIWLWIYHADYGLLNEILSFFGIGTVRWLNDPDTAIYALIIMAIWRTVGFCTVLYIAALQNVPDDVIEAAKVDGANTWNIIRKIKIPLVSPTTFLLLILLTIEQFQTFAQVNVMTGGGPARSTTLLVPFLWEHAFEKFEMGYSSAIAVILFLIVLILTLIQMFVIGKRVHYQ